MPQDPTQFNPDQSITQPSGQPTDTKTQDQPIQQPNQNQQQNKVITEQQFRVGMSKLPPGTDYKQVRQHLIDMGYTLEGYSPPVSPFKGDQTQNKTEQPKSVLGFAGNVIKSGADIIGGLFHAIAHPIDTAKNIAELGLGFSETAINMGAQVFTGKNAFKDPNDPNLQKYKAFLDLQAKRYGGVKNIKDTLYNDPLGVLLDATIVLDGGLSATGKLAELADAAGMTRTAEALSKAHEAISAVNEFPKAAAMKVAGPAVKYIGGKLGDVAASAVGSATGAGSEALKTASEASKIGGSQLDTFTKALRGETTAQNILDFAKQGLQKLFDKQKADYEKGLVDVTKNETYYTKSGQLYVNRELTAAEAAATKGYVKGTKIGVPTNITVKGLKDTITKTIKDFGGVGAKGEFDFNEIAIDKAHANKLNEVINRVYDWKDLTPLGVNRLRQVIDGYYIGGINLGASENRFNAIIESMKANISSYIGEKVPGIAKMNKQFFEASQSINKIEEGLKLENNPETAIKKLTSALKDDVGIKQGLIESLQSQSNIDLKEMIAGYNLNPMLSRSALIKYGEGFGVFTGLLHPTIWPVLAISSPRIVGEFLRAIGMNSSDAIRFQSLIRILKRGAQAGEITRQTSPPAQ